MGQPERPQTAGPRKCGLTLRSSGQPPAGHLGRAAASVIIRFAAQAPRRRQPLSSNVRPHGPAVADWETQFAFQVRSAMMPNPKLNGRVSVHRISWRERGSQRKAINCINAAEPFTLVLHGRSAAAMTSQFGPQARSLTPVEASVLFTLTIVVALAGVTLFALAKGYRVQGRSSTPGGREYEIVFEPKS